MTDIQHRNTIITDTIRNLTDTMGPTNWTTITPDDLEGQHLTPSLAWHTTGDNYGETRLDIPTTGEDGEPRITRITTKAEGGITIQLGDYPEASEDLRTALFNLIIGFPY